MKPVNVIKTATIEGDYYNYWNFIRLDDYSKYITIQFCKSTKKERINFGQGWKVLNRLRYSMSFQPCELPDCFIVFKSLYKSTLEWECEDD